MNSIEGLVHEGGGKFEEKLARFIGATATDLHLILDFDRTVTTRRPGMNDDVTSWHILKEHLPAKAQSVHQRLFEKYRALEIKGEMSRDDAVEWWSAVLDMFVEYKLDLNEVENDFIDKATIRPGAKELMQLCETSGVPTIIMSAGIREIIEMWCQAYAVNPSLVIATSLDMNEFGIVRGWDRETLVHSLNKNEVDHAELAAIRAERPMSIVIGDSMDDASMAEGDENVLRIRIHDPRSDEATDIEVERTRTLTRFDAMIEDGSLTPVVQMLAEIAKSKKIGDTTLS